MRKGGVPPRPKACHASRNIAKRSPAPCTESCASIGSRTLLRMRPLFAARGRAIRLPLQVNPGGKAGSYNADGGDMGRGSGTAYDVATVSPIFFRFAIEITKLVEYATNGRERAVENAAKREVANGMRQFRSFLDKLMQTAGNGVLGTINSIASTTFTMAVPSGAALVYVGQTVQVYDTT